MTAPVPLWLALLGLVGNSACFGIMFFRGDPLWLLFLLGAVVSYSTCARAKHQTAVRTAESD